MADFTGDPILGDPLSGTPTADTISGLGGDDVLAGLGGADALYGGDDNDAVYGGDDTDFMAGGNGNDTLGGGPGSDVEYGGDGNDTLLGGAGSDQLYGDAGQDTFTIETGGGADAIFGGADDDTIQAFLPKDFAAGTSIDGGSGEDVLELLGSLQNVYNLTQISISNIEGIHGSHVMLTVQQCNTLPLGAPHDKAVGTAISDLIVSGSGALNLKNHGELGVANFTLDAGGNEIDLRGCTHGGQGFGVVGGAGSNTIYGSSEGDHIQGGGAKDRIFGGGGEDFLTGGAAKDAFIFNKGSTGATVDHIIDFSGKDEIGLSRHEFRDRDGGKLGPIDINRDSFYAANGATKAHDKDDRIVYDKTTGALYFDKDGKGHAKAVEFAVLDGQPHLKFDDLMLVS